MLRSECLYRRLIKMPKVIVLEVGPLGGYESGALMNRISVLTEEAPES